MAFVLCLMPMSAMAEATDGGMNAQLEAILEIEPENMTYLQYFLFEHGFHSDEASADPVIFARRTSGGDALLARRGGTVYAGSEEVSGYAGNSEMVFYMAGDTIYRYHVRSRQTDAIYQGSGIVTWYPITSKVLLIGKNNGITASPLAPPVCTDELDLEGLAYFVADTDEHTLKGAENPGRLIALTQNGGYYNVPNFHTRINGKTVPFSKYPDGSTFEDSDYPGDATQCAAFALLVYGELWGSENYGSSVSPSVTSENAMKSAIQNLANGARIRVTHRDGSGGHSVILCSKVGDAITVYHANWGGPNEVHLTRFTYHQFYLEFISMPFAQNPC